MILYVYNKQLLDEAEPLTSRIIQTEVNVICRSEAEDTRGHTKQ